MPLASRVKKANNRAMFSNMFTLQAAKACRIKLQSVNKNDMLAMLFVNPVW